MIDLPKLKEPMPKQTFFQDELLHFCAAQEIPTHILTALDYYDFKETKNLAFVHSIGGSHGGDDWERTGYCGLGKAIKTLGYHSGKGLEVDYVVCISGRLEGAPAEGNCLRPRHLAQRKKSSFRICTVRRKATLASKSSNGATRRSNPRRGRKAPFHPSLARRPKRSIQARLPKKMTMMPISPRKRTGKLFNNGSVCSSRQRTPLRRAMAAFTTVAPSASKGSGGMRRRFQRTCSGIARAPGRGC